MRSIGISQISTGSNTFNIGEGTDYLYHGTLHLSMKIASRMLLEGISVEFVAKLTDLPIEMIEALQKETIKV